MLRFGDILNWELVFDSGFENINGFMLERTTIESYSDP